MCRLNAWSARFAIKAKTAEAHGRLDALFSRFDLSDRCGYAQFLRAQAGALLAVEDALDRAGASEVLEDWKDRKRGDALSDDMRAMAIEPNEVSAPTFQTEAEILGGIYVLEGSRIGGSVLLRRVSADMPTSFLKHEGPSSWRGFVGILDETLGSPVALEEAVGAATSVFHAFEASALHILRAHSS